MATAIVVFFLVFLFWNYQVNNWEVIIAGDSPKLADGWGEPVRVGINTEDWEDGAYISSDGSVLYFSYYPGDIMKDLQTRKFKDDMDVYYSSKPFEKKKLHPISEDIWSEGGVMFSGSDIYYMSNRNSPDFDNLYKNGHQLEYSDPKKAEQDPHYCAKKDEMYFWVDGIIYVHKNSSTTALPKPINDGSQNIQPFLMPDCETMYFTSDRKQRWVNAIYMSNRVGENGWSEPELVAESKVGVGEPTLTDNGKTMFFVVAFKSPRRDLNADIYYTERVEE